jgi:hypothetical protein
MLQNIWGTTMVNFVCQKVLCMCQVKIYINYLSSRGKGTTHKIHEEDKCVEC